MAGWERRVKTQLATGLEDGRKQKCGDTSVTFDAQGGLVPPDVLGLLQPYRTPNL